MAIFQSTEQFYAVMQEVFDYVMQRPEHVSSFTQSNLIIRMNIQEPDAEILLDGRQPPLGVFFGPRPGLANLEISLNADLLHALWMGTESTHQAFLSGRIQTRGNLLKALGLAEIFTAAERIYPAVARQYGLPDA
ncbi:SCP2 sterol-binding domain-containing protein [Caldilinea sp.]|uniref:SCP2 sterol-binding domain-containing protein n=1 Tax=Caldilinea sp. TaxID=2293560 RepID=UPI002C37AC74|nr:SCP2 sterol-binding domain-containing protein [Anaerolineales bacterium]HQY93243.1 SCP2 sterol-binding domain-containing protein [Caldilinea sp.]